MEMFLGRDKPPRACHQDPDIGGETSDFEVGKLPLLIKLPSVLIKVFLF